MEDPFKLNFPNVIIPKLSFEGCLRLFASSSKPLELGISSLSMGITKYQILLLKTKYSKNGELFRKSLYFFCYDFVRFSSFLSLCWIRSKITLFMQFPSLLVSQTLFVYHSLSTTQKEMHLKNFFCFYLEIWFFNLFFGEQSGGEIWLL